MRGWAGMVVGGESDDRPRTQGLKSSGTGWSKSKSGRGLGSAGSKDGALI